MPWSSWPRGLTSTPGFASFAGLGIPRKQGIQVYLLNWAETKKNNHVSNVYNERETDLMTLTLRFEKQRWFRFGGLPFTLLHRAHVLINFN